MPREPGFRVARRLPWRKSGGPADERTSARHDARVAGPVRPARDRGGRTRRQHGNSLGSGRLGREPQAGRGPRGPGSPRLPEPEGGTRQSRRTARARDPPVPALRRRQAGQEPRRRRRRRVQGEERGDARVPAGRDRLPRHRPHPPRSAARGARDRDHRVKKEKTMRFGLLQEAETEIGSTHYFRYRELVREVRRAEEMGFDYWGTSEQHFVSPLATVTAPEVLYGAIAAQTHTINIRHMVTLLPFAFNHPLRVAERMATLDIVSNGRAQLGCGRANHLWQLDAFQIKATETRAQMLEAMEVIDKALRLDEFEHEGPLLKIPKRRLSPRPVQHPRPPMYVIATSTESHQIAGERGHGVISCDNWLGWDHLREQAGIYTSTLSKAKPASGIINDSLGACALTGYCAETWEEAAKIGGPIAFSFLNGVLESLYLPLSKASKDYAYFGRIADELDELRPSGRAK